MLRQNPIPVAIVGGFLGAGKTTLLNQLLCQPEGRRIAVLVNDFGQINIDSQLVVQVTDQVIDLANGCICCSLRGDMLEACESLLVRPNPPDAILIETSGASDLGAVLRTFDEPQQQARFSLESVIVTADCETLDAGLAGPLGPLLRSQLFAADFVVLNKCDLVDRDRQRQTLDRLKSFLPAVSIVPTQQGRLPSSLVWAANRSQWVRRVPGAKSSNGHDLAALYWSSEMPLSLPQLQRAVEELPDCVYRAKGFVYLEELPRYRVMFQKVGRRYNLRDEDPWGAMPRRTDIVAIAQSGQFDDKALSQHFAEHLLAVERLSSPILEFTRRVAPDLVGNTISNHQPVFGARR